MVLVQIRPLPLQNVHQAFFCRLVVELLQVDGTHESYGLGRFPAMGTEFFDLGFVYASVDLERGMETVVVSVVEEFKMTGRALWNEGGLLTCSVLFFSPRFALVNATFPRLWRTTSWSW